MLYTAMTLMMGCAIGGTDEATWDVRLETSGENFSWYSPGTVRADASDYTATLEIVAASVVVSYAGFDFGPIDAMGNLPQTTYDLYTDGPCPASFGVESIHEPPPPEPVTIAFELETHLTGDGQCIIDMTDVVLGTASVDLGWPFGEVTVQLETITVDAVLTMTATGTLCSEDTDGNGDVNVNDALAVIAAWGPCQGCAADVNDDGVVDVNDMLAVIAAWGPC